MLKLRDAVLSPVNESFLIRRIQQELAKRSHAVWEEVERTWDRGCIEKPLIVPHSYDYLREKMYSAVEDYPGLFNQQIFDEVNQALIEEQVQFFISGAKQNFYYQKKLYRDHPLDMKRNPSQMREKSRDTGLPVSTWSYQSKAPSCQTQTEFWRGFRDIQ